MRTIQAVLLGVMNGRDPKTNIIVAKNKAT